ncbi:MAG: aldo/keto reductase [Segniliparus sp.]|uniref:aldo/keto reductase n=1 Tax=Segniliparus sp. TaxID=2804064 RepID=UPI003F3F38A1
MEFRQLGRSGLMVPVLTFGTGTFGGVGDLFSKWGNTDEKDADRLVNLCLDRGVNFFDTADNYSNGVAEEILGKALAGKRDKVLISTKTSCPIGEGPNEVGSSRRRIMRACEDSLRRLRTDHIDLYSMHISDMITPPDETLRALDDLIRAGKVSYIGVSNYAGWQFMKALSTADSLNVPRYISYQGYYSLIGRDYEHELMPLAIDQGVGLMAWSPLGWGRLTGRIKKGIEANSGRIAFGGAKGGPPVRDELLYRVIDALEIVSRETEKSIPQVAIKWVLARATVSTVIVGARNAEQLGSNLEVLGWDLTQKQISLLDEASKVELPYPYWHQSTLPTRNPISKIWNGPTSEKQD